MDTAKLSKVTMTTELQHTKLLNLKYTVTPFLTVCPHNQLWCFPYGAPDPKLHCTKLCTYPQSSAYVTASAAGSAGRSHIIYATTRAFVVLHTISFIKYVCPIVKTSLNDADRRRRKKTTAETRDERDAVLHRRPRVATSLTLSLQCSAFT